jgi:hypothetical protein
LEDDPWLDVLEQIETAEYRADDGNEYRIATDVIWASGWEFRRTNAPAATNSGSPA